MTRNIRLRRTAPCAAAEPARLGVSKLLPLGVFNLHGIVAVHQRLPV